MNPECTGNMPDIKRGHCRMFEQGGTVRARGQKEARRNASAGNSFQVTTLIFVGVNGRISNQYLQDLIEIQKLVNFALPEAYKRTG